MFNPNENKNGINGKLQGIFKFSFVDGLLPKVEYEDDKYLLEKHNNGGGEVYYSLKKKLFIPFTKIERYKVVMYSASLDKIKCRMNEKYRLIRSSIEFNKAE